MSHWVSGFEEETSATGHEGLDQSSEGWLADCFNNDEMHCSPDDLNLSGPSDVQIDISEFCNTPPEYEACVAQEHPTGTRKNAVFKGSHTCELQQSWLHPLPIHLPLLNHVVSVEM
ncbi:protein XRI1-like isoform X2 [Camellia sinensis]|uniref:protein XRI1-like isoform X2 n=1 Tax=Camellia sinensis TaxID=4442 RepID=UPI001035C6D0|nr:protein XRI1-like isoform X2 [Camellia sinensis]